MKKAKQKSPYQTLLQEKNELESKIHELQIKLHDGETP